MLCCCFRVLSVPVLCLLNVLTSPLQESSLPCLAFLGSFTTIHVGGSLLNGPLPSKWYGREFINYLQGVLPSSPSPALLSIREPDLILNPIIIVRKPGTYTALREVCRCAVPVSSAGVVRFRETEACGQRHGGGTVPEAWPCVQVPAPLQRGTRSPMGTFGAGLTGALPRST